MQLAGPPHRLAAFSLMLAGWCLSVLLFALPTRAAELEDVRKQFITGEYQACARNCQQAIADQEYAEEWRLLGIRSLLELGQYTNALELLTTSLERYSSSVQMRLLGHEVALRNGETERAATLLQEINLLAGSRTWAYRSPADLVALGRTALLLGADPKKVLTQFFDKAKKADPDYREAYLAGGQVALDKNDYDLASKLFTEGLKRFPDDPDLNYGLAQSYFSGDRRKMLMYIERALSENTNHLGSHLLVAEHMIDAEDYAAARKTLDRVHSVNPWHPKAWGFRAVLSHLANDARAETEARENGLKFWNTNPEVDYLVGKKLSQKYRFAEGAAYQRRALSFEKQYIRAKIQLADDLLRLGDETEGWQLAEEVNRDDGYDITAFNLVNLHDKMAKFQTLTNANFIVRMTAKEAPIYGRQVLDLLDRAKSNICAKYGIELDRPTTVEIFAEQKDFGVRTFGMPGNPGYLGVCFGPVITANSPASQAGHPANWQAVLWHEFCHVVTLQMTKNKMPRWLSEGISVFEERQANPTWGQAMNPKYREIILSTNLTPVGKLSAAFLTPKSDLDLQFAYYESYLVVEFLVERYGIDKIKNILHDLGAGAGVNETIAKHTAPIAEIEKDFAEFARAKARNLGPGLDWRKGERAALAAQRQAAEEDEDVPAVPAPKTVELPANLVAESTNYYVLIREANRLFRDKKWQEAKAPLEKLIKAYPDQIGPDSAYNLLAAAHRRLGETNDERRVLTTLADMEADALDAYARLMELGAAAKDWGAVSTNAERYLAVNPLLPLPYRYLAQASEANNQTRTAIEAYETMLQLDPPDPAEAHYRIARLQHQIGDRKAKRHLLQALEEAPRFRDAHKLLLEMHRAEQTQTKAETPAKVKPVSYE
jgi:tetratricopeptide (TPR) repeat protein